MQSRGYTLTELLVVVSLIALAATVAIPSLEPIERTKLDLVSTHVSEALRFARSESMRTGVPHGLAQDDGNLRTRVYRIDGGAQTFDVYHPIDKQIHDKRYGLPPYSYSGTMATSITFRGTCNDPAALQFDANGSAWCRDPANVFVEGATVSLTAGGETALINLDGLTGRVTSP